MHGRKGIRRCLQCRVTRQKVQNKLTSLTFQCVYQDVRLPCTLCSTKNLPCRAEDKIYGKAREMKAEGETQAETSQPPEPQEGQPEAMITDIRRQPPTPDNESVNQIEAIYIEFFRERQLLNFRVGVTRLRGFDPETYLFQRFGHYIRSKAVRYSAILYVTHQKDAVVDNDWRMQCQLRFYEHMQRVIQCNDFADVVYACYNMCIYGIETEQLPWHEIVNHFRGFLLGFEKFSTATDMPSEEIISVKVMCANLLSRFGASLRQQWMSHGPCKCLGETFMKIVEVTDNILRIVDVGGQSRSPTDSIHCFAVMQIQCYLLQIYLDYYPFERAAEGALTQTVAAQIKLQLEMFRVFFFAFPKGNELNTALEGLGNPPFDTGIVTAYVTNTAESLGYYDPWRNYFARYCAQYLQYFILSGDADLDIDDVLKAAVTICRIVVIEDLHGLGPMVPWPTLNTRPMLILAWFVLAKTPNVEGALQVKLN